MAQAPPSYRLRAGRTDSDGFPSTPAQLCFGPEDRERCYTPPEQEPPFGLNPQSKALKLKTGVQLILFTAESSAGGSGSLIILAPLEDRNGQVINLLPKVTVTNQSEYKAWDLPGVSAMPVLVAADFLWAAGETHFAPHQYRITAYVYDKQAGRYIERLSFSTKKKYAGLDNVDQIRVLEPERVEIVAKLMRH